MDSSTNDSPSHTPNGRFAVGNKMGRGNPHIDKVGKLRAAMFSAVSEKDMKKVFRKLVELAESGDIKAIDLLLNRVLGKPQDSPQVAIQNNVTNQACDREGRTQALLARLTAQRHPIGLADHTAEATS